MAVADRTYSRRLSLTGAAALRLALGLNLLYQYALHYSDRMTIWGPDGISPWNDFQEVLRETSSWSLYASSSSELWFELVFHAGIVAALAMLTGAAPRTVVLVNFVFVWSLFERSPLILDGGDNLLILLLVYLALVDSGSRLRLPFLKPRRFERINASRPMTLLHNAGVAAIVLQVCVIYLVSALYKAQGELWQNGTALYYVLRVNEFTLPGLSESLYSSALIVTLATYGTVVFQISFPALLLSTVGRHVAFCGAFMMHAGIAVMMGLVTFSWIMIAAELVLLPDSTFARVKRLLLRRFSARIRVRPQRAIA